MPLILDLFFIQSTFLSINFYPKALNFHMFYVFILSPATFNDMA